MFTKTTLSAMRALVYLGLSRREEPISPRHIAETLGESPTYLAKVVRYLVKPGILRARRGVTGGVVLNRLPGEITLQSVVEACQGAILGDFCSEAPELAEACALHQAGVELNQAILGVLSRWTLADLLNRPHPTASLDPYGRCWLAGSPAPGETGSARSDGAGGKAPALKKRHPRGLRGGKKGQAPFVRRQTLRVGARLRAVPGKGACPLFRAVFQAPAASRGARRSL
ncbi:MAG: RrF2 family transcriptional regulator [Thermoguttaceae bacterium]